MKRRIEDAWRVYRDSVVPQDAPEGQVRDMRLSFYAGAAKLFSMLVTGVSNDGTTEPTDDDLRMMDELAAEIEAHKLWLDACVRAGRWPEPRS